MDDIVLFKILLAIILWYFEVVLKTLKQYFMTIKLYKCIFLIPYQKLIGVEILNKVNSLYESNQTAL